MLDALRILPKALATKMAYGIP